VAGSGGAGTASLSGGAVAVDYTSGTFQTKTLILDSAGGLGGTTFTGVTDDLTAVVSMLQYDANDVYLVARLAVADQSGLTINQRNVATAIDDFFDGQSSFDLAFALDPAGLTTASGELGTGAIQAGFEASDRFLDVISDRFALPYEAPASGQPPAAYTEESASGTGAADAYAALLEKRSAHAMGAMVGGVWKAWGAVYGGAAEVDGDETVVGSHDLDTDVWGLAAGAGWRDGDAGFGIALGGGHSSFDLADGLGSGDAGLFNAGIYGRADFGEAYFLGALAYGYHDVSTSRVAFGDTLDADYGAHSFSGRAELGYRFDTGFVGLTPYAAFQGTALSIPSYSETGAGAFALNYDSDTATSARGELGLRLDHTVPLEDAALELSGRIAWAYAGDTERSMVAGFQTLPGTSFIVYGAEPDSNSALVDLGAAMHWTNGWSAKLSFQGQFSGNYSSYSGSAKVGFAW
jgi:outer membrane autotransporter protein